jgi:hypothetical protein
MAVATSRYDITITTTSRAKENVDGYSCSLPPRHLVGCLLDSESCMPLFSVLVAPAVVLAWQK